MISTVLWGGATSICDGIILHGTALNCITITFYCNVSHYFTLAMADLHFKFIPTTTTAIQSNMKLHSDCTPTLLRAEIASLH